MKRIILNTNYDVVAENNVTLTIVFGDEQMGVSAVILNGQELARGDISDLLIGTGDKINNLKLKIKSVVTDINDSTDNTSITYIFKGGKADREFGLTGISEGNGSIVAYISEFLFKI